MKINFLSFFLLTLMGPVLLFGKVRPENSEQEQPNIMSLADFAKCIETGMPLENLRNLILECPKGAELPLKMTILGDTLSLEPNFFTLKLLKPIYLKSGKGPLMFSSDLKEWQEFSEFFVGKAAAALDFQSQVAQVNFELELNQQKNRWEIPLTYNDQRYREIYIHTWTPYPDPAQLSVPSSIFIEPTFGTKK